MYSLFKGILYIQQEYSTKEKVYIQYRSAKYFELNSPIFFEPQGLMADWGTGLHKPTAPPQSEFKPLKRNFHLTIHKKGDRSLPEIN